MLSQPFALNYHRLKPFLISKFWSSFHYFLGIKRQLSTTLYSQIDGQIKRQNSTIEAYFRAFVYFEQNNCAKLLPMTKFT